MGHIRDFPLSDVRGQQEIPMPLAVVARIYKEDGDDIARRVVNAPAGVMAGILIRVRDAVFVTVLCDAWEREFPGQRIDLSLGGEHLLKRMGAKFQLGVEPGGKEPDSESVLKGKQMTWEDWVQAGFMNARESTGLA